MHGMLRISDFKFGMGYIASLYLWNLSQCKFGKLCNFWIWCCLQMTFATPEQCLFFWFCQKRKILRIREKKSMSSKILREKTRKLIVFCSFFGNCVARRSRWQPLSAVFLLCTCRFRRVLRRGCTRPGTWTSGGLRLYISGPFNYPRGV